MLCAGLLYALIRSQDQGRAERAELCQRIQAPEVAVAQHVHETIDGPDGLPYVPPDSDELAQENWRELTGGAA